MLSMIISGCKSNDVANATNENEVVIPAKGPAEDTNTYTFAEYMNNKDKETNLFLLLKLILVRMPKLIGLWYLKEKI